MSHCLLFHSCQEITHNPDRKKMKVGLGVHPVLPPLRVSARLLLFCSCVEPNTLEGSCDHHQGAKTTP